MREPHGHYTDEREDQIVACVERNCTLPRRTEWMLPTPDNDSSMPAGEISGEPTYADLVEMVSGLRADAVKRTSELHTWKETATALRAERDHYEGIVTSIANALELPTGADVGAEVERMRPVVEAACEWVKPDKAGHYSITQAVYSAVDAFCAAQQETTEWCDPCGKHHAPPSHDAAEVHDR